jgi:hypothetical protein
MSWIKDLYIKQLELEIARLEDAGVRPDQAYEKASERAYYLARDAMAAEADMLRARRKDEAVAGTVGSLRKRPREH